MKKISRILSTEWWNDDQNVSFQYVVFSYFSFFSVVGLQFLFWIHQITISIHLHTNLTHFDRFIHSFILCIDFDLCFNLKDTKLFFLKMKHTQTQSCEEKENFLWTDFFIFYECTCLACWSLLDIISSFFHPADLTLTFAF